ncbi:MAG: PKD domain-containing protein, partial [Sphingobacteriales bacterium]
TYHVAMVYDGQALKFYRNGFLLSQVAASGNLYQNDFQTWIGYYAAQIHNTSFIGYINEVRIWNVARSQAEIRSTMTSSLPAPTGMPGLVAYYRFGNLLNRQGNAAFNGLSDGVATTNVTNPTCATFTIDSCSTNCTLNEDFSFKTQVCNPLEASFNTSASGYTAVRWLFGDGAGSAGSTTVSHTYAAPGTYAVSLILTNATCTDTITKSLLVGAQYEDILITRDTALCAPGPIQLRSQPALSFCWSPSAFLDNPNSPNPISNSPTDITYTYTAEVVGNNLITNGNFSTGNTGFTSAYNYTAFNTTEGEYYVGANPQSWNVALSGCGDHTTGSGNMMLVNGAPASDVQVWTQTISVTPNTNYAFSTWIQALWPPNPAQLSFSINGKDIGSQITASLPTCTWTQFYTTWNSGNTTTATISIVNKNTQIQGNDFALDDISFAPVFIKRDSVRIKIEQPKVSTIT